ncbi:hypothetical protein IAT38_000571 [Cryptococcus sp. DSM 104549]
MLTLKSLSPSRTSLTIPPLSTSPFASPLASPAGSATSTTSRRPSSSDYFPPVNRAPPKRVPREEALKNVKAIEGVLAAWNEYRAAVAGAGKAGKKLAGAVRELVGCMDKTQVPAQTMRPTAAMIDKIAELTTKLAKKVDKEYEEANSSASKYFTLLAKESRTHDAYLGAIGKKHDKAAHNVPTRHRNHREAYRKASKSLSDTSSAHAGLFTLKETLIEDINRAHDDHQCLIGSKQAVLLLQLASSCGVLASSQLAFLSDGLRKAGAVYPDIEYFQALADIQWQCALPPSLDEAEEDAKCDHLRLMKARVALGEMDVVGTQTWEGLQCPPGTRAGAGEGQGEVEGEGKKRQGEGTPLVGGVGVGKGNGGAGEKGEKHQGGSGASPAHNSPSSEKAKAAQAQTKPPHQPQAHTQAQFPTPPPTAQPPRPQLTTHNSTSSHPSHSTSASTTSSSLTLVSPQGRHPPSRDLPPGAAAPNPSAERDERSAPHPAGTGGNENASRRQAREDPPRLPLAAHARGGGAAERPISRYEDAPYSSSAGGDGAGHVPPGGYPDPRGPAHPPASAGSAQNAQPARTRPSISHGHSRSMNMSNSRPDPIPLPRSSSRRSVSQIAAAFSLLTARQPPTQRPTGSRRVTMPPTYTASPLLLPSSSSDAAHAGRYAPQEGYRHSLGSGYFGHHDEGYGHGHGRGYEFEHRSDRGDRGDGGYPGQVDRRSSVVAPRPVRVSGISPELHEYEE